MATQREDFMYNQSLQDFKKLKDNIGNQIVVNYLRDGEAINSMGTLNAVYPFDCIVYTGGIINFVSKSRIIREIRLRGGESLYDRTYIVPSNAKIGNDISKYKRAIMGAEQLKKSAEVDLNNNLNIK